MEAEEAVAEIQAEMAAPGAYDDPTAAKDLGQRHDAAKDAAARATATWEKLVDKLEKAEAG